MRQSPVSWLTLALALLASVTYPASPTEAISFLPPGTAVDYSVDSNAPNADSSPEQNEPVPGAITVDTEVALDLKLEFPLADDGTGTVGTPALRPELSLEYLLTQSLTPNDALCLKLSAENDSDDHGLYFSNITLAYTHNWGTWRFGKQASLLEKIIEFSGPDRAHGSDENLFGSDLSKGLLTVEPQAWGALQWRSQLLFPEPDRENDPHHGGIGGLCFYRSSHLSLGCSGTLALTKPDQAGAQGRQPWGGYGTASLLVGGIRYIQDAWTLGLTGSWGKDFLPIDYLLETEDTKGALDLCSRETAASEGRETQSSDGGRTIPRAAYASETTQASRGTKTAKAAEAQDNDGELLSIHAERSLGAQLLIQHDTGTHKAALKLAYRYCHFGKTLDAALSRSETTPVALHALANCQLRVKWILKPWVWIGLTVTRDLRDLYPFRMSEATLALARHHEIGGRWPEAAQGLFDLGAFRIDLVLGFSLSHARSG